MRSLHRLSTRVRDGRPGVPFALLVGVAAGLLIANLLHPGGSSPAGAAGNPGAATGSTPAGAVTGGTSAPSAQGGGTGPSGAGSSGTGSAGAGSSGPAPGGSGPGAGTSGSTAAAQQGQARDVSASGGATARGVTAKTITVGIAYLDLSGVQYLGPDYNVGNVQEQWKALVDGWHEKGLLPVNGRDIKLVFHSFNVLQPSQQRSVCDAMVQDDKVFAVVAPEFFYQYGAECVTGEYHTPLITSDGPMDDVYQRGAPFLYTIMPSADQLMKNMVAWANQRGMLAGKKIGIYHANDPSTQRMVDRSIKAPLAALGYKVTAEATTGNANGGPDDTVAVQQFKAKGVDLAIVMTSNIGFMQQAQAQGYKPEYIGSDYGGYTTYLQAADYPPGEFDGSYAVTTTDRGEPGAGVPLSPAAQACVDNYNRYSGEHVGRPAGKGQHDTAELVYVLMSCDEGKLLLDALKAAGPDLTPLSFARQMQQQRNVPMDYFPPVTFGPGRYTGVTEQATVQWHGSCTCWARVGSFEPMSLSRS